ANKKNHRKQKSKAGQLRRLGKNKNEIAQPYRLKERESANSACRDEALTKAGPKIVKKITKNTKIAQKMTKSARFLQKNHKKSQKIHVFLTQMRPKSTTLRQIRKPNPPHGTPVSLACESSPPAA
ncbi:MAG: hypothetical protein MUO22_08970, partial [Sedimentisphaerales bacterium]|nr:hypothetical protein [Sedimentisphaerales bacterium]